MPNPFVIADVGHGRGVVATDTVAPGTVLARFVGPEMPLAEVPERELNYVVRVARDSYLIPGPPARFFNHSCDPNCIIDDHFDIVTRRPVPKGDQLTIAYNQVTPAEAEKWGPFWHPRWTFACHCGAERCVGTVDRYVVVSATTAHESDALSVTETTIADRAAITSIAEEIGTFTPEEVRCLEHDITSELEASSAGVSRDRLVTVRWNDEVIGFTHSGPLAMTVNSWMLYWILLSPRFHGMGIGCGLIRRVERHAVDNRARIMLIETSDQPAFAAARRMYEKCGYHLAATIADFYDDRHGKCIFARSLGSIA